MSNGNEIDENKNIKVNDDGTISPIDPSKPSLYTTDFSEGKVIEAILLNMEWCHAVKTESLEKAKAAIEALISQREREARIEWLDEQIKHLLSDIYPEDVFTPPTDADFKKINEFDANLHTRLHCDGIRHGLHVLRREVRGLSARDDLGTLSGEPETGAGK